MPLADHAGVIAGGAQHLGDRGAVVVQLPLIRWLAQILIHRADARLVRVEAGEQGRPRRAAAGHVVELRDANAVGRERIDIGCANFAAVAADVGEAEVIGKDNDDIGTLWSLRRCGLHRDANAKTDRQENSAALLHHRSHLTSMRPQQGASRGRCRRRTPRGRCRWCTCARRLGRRSIGRRSRR